MKRLLAFVVAIIVIIAGVGSFSADTVFSIDLTCDEMLKNSLFEVSVAKDSGADLCAGEMTLTFDESIVEFQEAKSDNFDIEAKENGGTLHIVFAKADKTKSSSELFRLVFKSLGCGTFDLSATCSECVDVNLNKLDFEVESTKVLVDKTGANLVSEGQAESGIENNSVNSSSLKNPSTLQKLTTSIEESIDIEDGNGAFVIVLVVIVFCVVIAIAFYFGVLFSKKTSSKNLVEDDVAVDTFDDFYY